MHLARRYDQPAPEGRTLELQEKTSMYRYVMHWAASVLLPSGKGGRGSAAEEARLRLSE